MLFRSNVARHIALFPVHHLIEFLVDHLVLLDMLFGLRGFFVVDLILVLGVFDVSGAAGEVLALAFLQGWLVWEGFCQFLLVFILGLLLLHSLLRNILSNQPLLLPLRHLLIIHLLPLALIILQLDLLLNWLLLLLLLSRVFSLLLSVLVVPVDIFSEAHVEQFGDVFPVLNHFANEELS